ncbi:hypothetical protein [Jiella marina]|uniref:hypothetical protein n=1 Tax=Jiella sp. LLJ827 TaxID=2917712 RepID=UPI002100E7C0|nr:hypothetical protein [Jiella sp. LLJ827]MCQ0990417.1 hypothetical protein [Jiella sp. LLJ827]
MSDTSNTPGSSGPDHDRLKSRMDEEARAARHEGEHAREHAKADARAFADQAKDRAYQGADQAKQTVSSDLEDFAAAVRKASDELGERDQSMASQLVREVAGGLEHASRNIGGRDVGELTRSVAAFGRERPVVFMAGMALAGLALGRFVQASSEDDRASGSSHSTGSNSGRSQDEWRDPARPSGPRPAHEPVPASVSGAPPTTTSASGVASVSGGATSTTDSHARSTLASPQSPARSRPSDITNGDQNER